MNSAQFWNKAFPNSTQRRLIYFTESCSVAKCVEWFALTPLNLAWWKITQRIHMKILSTLNWCHWKYLLLLFPAFLQSHWQLEQTVLGQIVRLCDGVPCAPTGEYQRYFLLFKNMHLNNMPAGAMTSFPYVSVRAPSIHGGGGGDPN